MRIVLWIVGILLLLMGVVWFFQGIGMLPGSFMTGAPQWAVYGAAAAAAGVFCIYRARRMGRP